MQSGAFFIGFVTRNESANNPGTHPSPNTNDFFFNFCIEINNSAIESISIFLLNCFTCFTFHFSKDNNIVKN